MKTPEKEAAAALAIPTVPVICDQCRAEGEASGDGFEQVADILDFEPVPRRRHVNGWTPEHQRAFIAVLAMTGSSWLAAKKVRRHHFGAEKLRDAPGGKGFRQAWDAAIEIARDRELARLRSDMAGLSAASVEEAREAAADAEERDRGGWDEDYDDSGHREYLEGQERIRDRLLRARRLLLWTICRDEAMRSAWETLAGPVDWDKAEKMEPQDNEPFPVMMRKADMLLTVEGGMLHDVVGAGRNFGAELLQAAAEYRETGRMPGEGESPSAAE
jgi:hypothetical protein